MNKPFVIRATRGDSSLVYWTGKEYSPFSTNKHNAFRCDSFDFAQVTISLLQLDRRDWLFSVLPFDQEHIDLTAEQWGDIVALTRKIGPEAVFHAMRGEVVKESVNGPDGLFKFEEPDALTEKPLPAIAKTMLARMSPVQLECRRFDGLASAVDELIRLDESRTDEKLLQAIAAADAEADARDDGDTRDEESLEDHNIQGLGAYRDVFDADGEQ
jgi:hypothetical protein